MLLYSNNIKKDLYTFQIKFKFMKYKGISLLALITASISMAGITPKITKYYVKDSSSLEQKLNPPILEIDTSLYKYNSEHYSQEELKKFNEWVDSTISQSKRNNTNSIIVNKLKKKLYLIENGEIHSKYNIDLGFSPIQDKQKEGDGCTPEGMYLVQRKISQGTTNFYKAFLINYPNKQDKAKGKTGGLIEIHGKGGLGYDWTLGCMALTDQDMDKIFPYIEEGNRITIVRDTSKELK